ncbi:MAG: hypothetical protein IJW87_04910 [Clostridia bacterium]|nr:hypothetical protein [Clostridia bacterium]
MKKAIYLLVITIVCFCFVSCSAGVNMQTLLRYQEADGTEFSLCIHDGEQTFEASLAIGKEDLMLTFTDGERAGIAYRQKRADGSLSVCMGDFEIPIPETERAKCTAWFALFSLSAEGSPWKIKKQKPGGIDVFVCRSDSVTLYVDAAEYFPLRIVSEAITIDICGRK